MLIGYSFFNRFSILKKNYVIDINYEKPLDEIDKYLPQHVDFLTKNYESAIFLSSGPKSPRTGGIIIASAKTRADIEKVLENDPFKKLNLASYVIIEFEPRMQTPSLIQNEEAVVAFENNITPQT